jgi:HD-like signal output (HDOD) protein
VELSRGRQVQVCLDRILAHGDLPAFAHHIHELMGALDSDDATLRRLTNLILNDYSLLLAVMRTANSYPYNRSGKPICSVTHAVALLGVNAIRSLASGLVFLEHYQGKSAGLTELLLLSCLTASHARHLARRLDPRRIEEAHLCGMFRNLGEVLVACYLPEDYVAILRRMKERGWSDREACLSIKGFYFEELGQGMARHWRLPEPVCESIRETGSNEGADGEKRTFDAIVRFSHELTKATYRDGGPGSNERIEALVLKYRELLGLTPADVRQILDDGIRDTREAFATLNLPLNDLHLQRLTDAALGATNSAETRQEPAEASGAPVRENLLHTLETEVKAGLAPGAAMDLNHVILMVLEAIYRGGPFDRVLLCLMTPDRSELRGRLGLGDGADELASEFRLSLSATDDALVAHLLSRQDLFVAPEMLASYGSCLLTSILRPACFGLYPLVVDEQAIGCLYFDRKLPVPLSDPGVLSIISRLRDSAAVAISRSRAAPTHAVK